MENEDKTKEKSAGIPRGWVYLFLIAGGMLNPVANYFILLGFMMQGVLLGILAMVLMVAGSYYCWVRPKNRHWGWLAFPALIAVLGYLPLMLMAAKEKKQPPL
jgi:hypothetical protein